VLDSKFENLVDPLGHVLAFAFVIYNVAAFSNCYKLFWDHSLVTSHAYKELYFSAEELVQVYELFSCFVVIKVMCTMCYVINPDVQLRFQLQSKGGILSKACDYITELRQANNSLSESVKDIDRLNVDCELLRQQVEELKNENLILRTSLQSHGIHVPDTSATTTWLGLGG